MATGARGYKGAVTSCDGGCTEVRLSPENSRSNVGEEGSSRGFEERVASFARELLALVTKRSIGLCEVNDCSG